MYLRSLAICALKILRNRPVVAGSEPEEVSSHTSMKHNENESVDKTPGQGIA